MTTSPAATRCLLIRHGQTDWNVAGRYQGHLDTPLNAQGLAQAELVGQRLADSPLDLILSSDLERAHRTAQIIAKHQRRAVLVQTTRALREMHMGQAQGLRRDEIIARFGPQLVARWREPSPDERGLDLRFPGGESKREVVARALRALEQTVREGRYAQLAVTSHGGVLKHLLHALFPSQDSGAIPNCAVFELSFEHDAGLWRYHGLLAEPPGQPHERLAHPATDAG